MSDLADITDARQEKIEELQKRARESFKAEVSEDCVDCGVLIPKARQEATGGTCTCIDCQEILEFRNVRSY